MKIAAPLLAIVILSGCNAESASPRMTRQERLDAAADRMTQTPKPRTYRFADAELRVMEVPAAGANGYVDQKQCFVWRDLEFKTSSITCVSPGPMVQMDPME